MVAFFNLTNAYTLETKYIGKKNDINAASFSIITVPTIAFYCCYLSPDAISESACGSNGKHATEMLSKYKNTHFMLADRIHNGNDPGSHM